MNPILFLLAASSLLGLVLGFYFSWLAIGVSGLVLAFLSAVVLQHEGFGSLAEIAIIVACLTVNQIACLIGVMSVNRGIDGYLRTSPTGERSNNHVASEYTVRKDPTTAVRLRR
jgi:hypothetical protein